MTRTEIIARAILNENVKTNDGAIDTTPLFWHALTKDQEHDMLALAQVAETVMEHFSSCTEMSDLVETMAGAMCEGYTGLNYDFAPTEVKQHWRGLGKAAITSYRESFFEPSDERKLVSIAVV